MREVHAKKTLAGLKPGQRAQIQAIASDDAALTQRLLALGFAPGTEVEARRRAPLGDPTEYALLGTRLCLRRSEARLILLCDEAAQPADAEDAP